MSSGASPSKKNAPQKDLPIGCLPKQDKANGLVDASRCVPQKQQHTPYHFDTKHAWINVERCGTASQMIIEKNPSNNRSTKYDADKKWTK